MDGPTFNNRILGLGQKEELADILLYLIRFADMAGIDLQRAADEKLVLNAQKYPVDRFRGSDRKYNESE